MTTVALLLVLGSAVAHASWNLLAKRVAGGPAFIWLFELTSVILVAPFAAAQFLLERPDIGGRELGLMAGSALLQLVYTLLLTYGYRIGDLSLVYPLVRGSGQVFAIIGAVLLLGERPTPLALLGAVLMVVGIVALTGDRDALREARAARAAGCALLCGVMVASYTLWDKAAVSAAALPPIFYFWATTVGRVTLLTPVVLRHPATVRATWSAHPSEIVAVGALGSFAYILVLTALVTSPVSYVAPIREIGILFGVLLGSRLLAEGHTKQRLGAAGAMLLGVIALALG